MVKDESALIVENVRIKEFTSLQEFAKYRGVNNVLSRGFNGMEKAGNAALATQHEFYQKIFQKAKELKANISVITKYYNQGKTLSLIHILFLFCGCLHRLQVLIREMLK